MTPTRKANDLETQNRQAVGRWGAGNKVGAEHFFWWYSDTNINNAEHYRYGAHLRGNRMRGLHIYLAILQNHDLNR